MKITKLHQISTLSQEITKSPDLVDTELNKLVPAAPFPAPVLVVDDFLPTNDAALCLQECIDLRKVYMPGLVGAGTANRRDERIRKNDVVMLDNVFRQDPKRSDILTLVDKCIDTKECKDLWHEGYTIFDTVNYRTWNESVLSCYGKCNFYGRHQDTIHNPDARGEITRRLVTLVLYFNNEPEQFSGGRLTLYHGNASVIVQPKHNRAVVFPSFMFHEVEKVTMPDDAPWSTSRFSLNRWMGFR